MDDTTVNEKGERYLVRNVKVVRPGGAESGEVFIEDGVISQIGAGGSERAGFTVIDGAGRYAIPGFVDIHCHGGAGFDLTVGEYDPGKRAFDASPEVYARCLPELMRRLAADGTTRAMLATIAHTEERVRSALSHLGDYVRSDRNGRDGAVLHGAFIEGTFVKKREFAGAQNPDHFREPSIGLFEKLNEAAQGTISYVNVVPEHGQSALELTKYLAGRGILVGAGHTEVAADDYLRAVANGLRVAVHFTNGPTGSSFKPFGGGGVVQAVLASRDVFAELIVDGYHVNPAYVLDIMKRKGADRVIAISDAMFLLDVEGVEEFTVSGIQGRVSDNRAYLEVVGKKNTLFGSVLKMRVGFGNLLSWLTRPMPGIWNEVHEPLGLEDAILVAVQACCANPSAVLGGFDAARYLPADELGGLAGEVEEGRRADLCLIRVVGAPGKYAIEVDEVFVGGRRMG